MTRSTPTRLRRYRIAGAATAGLLSLGLLTACGSGSSGAGSSSAAGAAPRSSAAEEVEAKSGLQPGDALASHNFGLSMEGRNVEFLAEVQGLEMEQDQTTLESVDGRSARRLVPGAASGGEVTIVRGMTRSEELTRFAAGEIMPKTVSIVLYDFEDHPVKWYELEDPKVTKIDRSSAGEASAGTPTEALTIRFSHLTIH
jgi:phage tail-like protein